MKTIFDTIQRYNSTLQNYLEADYHIWNEDLILRRKELLERPGVISNTPFVESSPKYRSGSAFSDLNIPKPASQLLVALANIPNSGVYFRPRSHQSTATELFLGPGDRELIVSTGTGSGKTESFLYPIIGSLGIEGSKHTVAPPQKAVRVLLLYPMNALVNDQLGRLRKLFGNLKVSTEIKRKFGRKVTFGVYTSRTPYPGERTKAKDKKLSDRLDRLYLGNAIRHRSRLEAEGLWPSKDMEHFLKNNLSASDDEELLTRNEIQSTPPDLLVTNYSMLEYMLARPIEQNIFKQTENWLKEDENNYLTIVLDEAHVYRGAVGTEVAFLLRRLQSRLKAKRSQIRYILTTASLGGNNTKEAEKFAKDLTGQDYDTFSVITSEIDEFSDPAQATEIQTSALAEFATGDLQEANSDIERAKNAVALLMKRIGLGEINTSDVTLVGDLKIELYQKLQKFGPAALLGNAVTKHPMKLNDLYDLLFPLNVPAPHKEKALDTLLNLVTFACSKENGQVFLPVRLHLMFRGLQGLYGCINPDCDQIKSADNRIVGEIYPNNRLQCRCGGKVFELLSHRDCGALFIKAYYDPDNPDFYVSEQAAELAETKMREAHLLIEPESRVNHGDRQSVFVDVISGQRLEVSKGHTFRRVFVSPKQGVLVKGRPIWTFEKCPVCQKRCVVHDDTKIQDLATKGETPFAYLIREQVLNQSPSRAQSAQYPLAGRKSLIFSDGRQKAARLARSMPLAIEKDLFRACLYKALINLHSNFNYTDPLASHGYRAVYVSLLLVLRERNILLFNSHRESEQTLIDHLKIVDEFLEEIRETYQGNAPPQAKLFESLTLRLGNVKLPHQFYVLFLTSISSEYYSLQAFLLAIVMPKRNKISRLKKKLESLPLSEEDLIDISHNWITLQIITKLAYAKEIPPPIRKEATGLFFNKTFGYTVGANGPGRSKFFKRLASYLSNENLKMLEEALLETFCHSHERQYFIDDVGVYIETNLDRAWYQCKECTRISYRLIKGCCPHGSCNSDQFEKLDPENSTYLGARKGFFREPVLSFASDNLDLYNISVEEHTAQLSHRDEETSTSTTEEYERRFKDILVDDDDTPVDVLSCTTTMEVGVDIGSLVAVALRNVPPARQNYQQRAGRAGRRGSSISTVITYAQNGSHDSYFFANPERIIFGSPQPPKIDIGNPKILRRHINAAIIQSFFHRSTQNSPSSNDLLSVLGKTSDFYSSSTDFGFDEFVNYVEGFSELDEYQRILSWIPESFTDLGAIAKDLRSQLSKEKIERIDAGSRYEENFLDFLFQCDLMPTYAFPRNMAEFSIERRPVDFGNPEIIQKPQQGLSTALSEYAPGRALVVNKEQYIVGSVTARSEYSEPNRAAKLFQEKRVFFQCGSCFFTEENPSARHSGMACDHCQSTKTEIIDVIQPEVMYPLGREPRDKQDNDEDVYTRATSAQLPFVGEEDNSDLMSFKATARSASRLNQELVMLNRGKSDSGTFDGFLVCTKCGRASPETDHDTGPHQRDYYVTRNSGKNDCDGEFKKVNLGYAFNSDVFLMRIPINFPLVNETYGLKNQALVSSARTLAEAMLIRARIFLEIESSELNCGVRLLRLGAGLVLDIFIYDTAAGGAGYAKLVGDYSNTIFDGAKEHLTTDCCDESCYMCLRDYQNRFSHSSLDKGLGLDLWRYIEDESVPEWFDYQLQSDKGKALFSLLSHHGISIAASDDGKYVLARGEKSEIALFIHPVLRAIESAAEFLPKDCMCVSDFEIKHSLSSVYANALVRLKDSKILIS